MHETGYSISSYFSHFDSSPLGVASLAQVHYGVLLDGREVAIKFQHPNLEKYCSSDIETCYTFTKICKFIFPEFKFEWLADEMRKSIPVELDFVNEARNAEKVNGNFRDIPTICVPQVYWASKKVLLMECTYSHFGLTCSYKGKENR
jgi:aarF domain-containing kinase